MFQFRFYCHWQAFDYNSTLCSLSKTYGVTIQSGYEGLGYTGPHYLEVYTDRLKKGFEVLRDLKQAERSDLAIKKVLVDGKDLTEILPRLFEIVETSIMKLKSCRGKQPSRKEEDIRRLLQKSLNFR